MSAPRWQMLPGGLLEEPGAKRSARDWIVDVSMTLVAIAVGIDTFGETEDLHSDGMAFLDLLLGIASVAALWWRRRWPLAIALIAIVPGMVSAFSGRRRAARAVQRRAARVAARDRHRHRRRARRPPRSSRSIYDDPELPYGVELVLGALFTLLVVPWGLFARTQRDLLRSSHERAARLEAEQRAHVEQAREAERRRIAGEMHDVLAHRLSLLSVHAGALEFRPDAPPEEIAAAAAVIRENAHGALRDLREVIGVLRDSPDDVEPPQPTLDAIPALIEESRAAGMRVRSRIEAGGGEATVGRTAYRVVQEGLTNARKHAPAAAVEVIVAADEQLVVEVVSRRAARAVEPGSGGSGLIGLSERVALAGGELEHGRNPGGDFVLRATLPWTA